MFNAIRLHTKPRLIRLLTCLAALLAISENVQANSDPTTFEQAHTAVVHFDNVSLEALVSQEPRLLLEQDENGNSLISSAIQYLNDDLIYQSNFEFIYFLIESDFLGQDVNHAFYLTEIVSALRRANKQMSRVGLSDDLLVQKSRIPYIQVLSIYLESQSHRVKATGRDSFNAALGICDAISYQTGDIDALSFQATKSLKAALSSTQERNLVSYVTTGILNAECVTALLNADPEN